MKKLIISSLLVPLAIYTGKDQSTTILDVRTGKWPISLERTIDRKGTSYSLQFRDVQELNAEVLDTLPFPDLEQLKYFSKALGVLKKGNNGDIAQFKTYSVKRADKKFEGVFYIVRHKWSETDFQQTEADQLVKAIDGL